MTTTLSNLDREWSEHYKLACWIIHRRLRQKLGATTTSWCRRR